MKKTLALILTVILAFSCFSLCTVSPAAMAEQANSNNLAANYTYDNFSFRNDATATGTFNATKVTAKNGGYAFSLSSMSWQGMHTTFAVTPGTTYKLSFYTKSILEWQYARIAEASTWTYSDDDHTISDQSQGVSLLEGLDINTKVGTTGTLDDADWVYIEKEFTPTTNEYALAIKFKAKPTGADTSGAHVIISDLTLSAKETVPTYYEGNGAVKAEPAIANYGDAVTYTANPYQSDVFLGWYVNGEKVSTDTTYTGAAFTNAPTAKFTGTNLLADYTHADWDNSIITVKDGVAESRYGGANSIKITNTWRGTHLSLPVEAGKQHTLSFSYKAASDATFQLYVGEVYGYDSEGKQTNGNWYYNTNSCAVSAEWAEFTLPFTADKDTIDLHIGTLSVGVTISDLSLTVKEIKTVPTDVEGNGAVKASPATAFTGDEVTLTANAYNNDAFLGWYIDGEKVSDEATYKISAFVDTVPTAKFTSTNLLADMTADDWYTESTSDLNVYDGAGNSNYGGTSIKLGNSWRGAHISLPVENGKTYKLNFSYYIPSNEGTSELIRIDYRLGYNTSYGDDGQQTNGTWIESKYFTTWDAWTEHTVEFTVSTTSDIQLVIAAGTNNGIYMSDFSLVEATPVATSKEGDGNVIASPAATFYGDACDITYTATANAGADFVGWYDAQNNLLSTDASYTASATPTAKFTAALVDGKGNTEIGSFKGNAIRQTGKQGLRFSFNLTENDLISSDFEGYTVKEIGAVAIRNDYLGDAELKIGTEKAKSVTFEASNISNEGVVSFRLYNIGVTMYSDGSIKSTDYTVYGTDLTVRLYKVLEKDGREVVVYGDAQTASVFATMKAILEANISESDVEAVNAMLNATTVDDAGLTVQQAYNTYLDN